MTGNALLITRCLDMCSHVQQEPPPSGYAVQSPLGPWTCQVAYHSPESSTANARSPQRISTAAAINDTAALRRPVAMITS